MKPKKNARQCSILDSLFLYFQKVVSWYRAGAKINCAPVVVVLLVLLRAPAGRVRVGGDAASSENLTNVAPVTQVALHGRRERETESKNIDMRVDLYPTWTANAY